VFSAKSFLHSLQGKTAHFVIHGIGGYDSLSC
jgi:hypothetical protein